MISQAKEVIITKILIFIISITAIFNLFWFNSFDVDIRDGIEGFVVGQCLVYVIILIIAAIRRRNKEGVDSKKITLNRLYLTIGMLSLIIGTILKRISFTGDWIHYVTGILFISSIFFNLAYIVRLKKMKQN